VLATRELAYLIIVTRINADKERNIPQYVETQKRMTAKQPYLDLLVYDNSFVKTDKAKERLYYFKSINCFNSFIVGLLSQS
jgi:hypothetical protein